MSDKKRIDLAATLTVGLVFTISSIGVGILFNRLWVATRNREGYILDEALKAESEEAVIQKLSQGGGIFISKYAASKNLDKSTLSSYSTRNEPHPNTVVKQFYYRFASRNCAGRIKDL